MFSVTACFHPFPYPGLGLLVFVVACSVYVVSPMEERNALVLDLRVEEIAAHVVECVEHREGLLLAAFTHEFFPIYVKSAWSASPAVSLLGLRSAVIPCGTKVHGAKT